jgi:2-oxoisovalerate dehydrogenase E2 component (dihydrolipoyl transacylase)
MDVRQFVLPDLGEGLEDAEVVTWHVAEGDRVELNQTLVEVNTAKALVEIPAPWEGVIEKLHAAEGDVVNVGAPLVSIRVKGSASVGMSAVADEREVAESEAEAGDEVKPKRRAVLVGYGVEEESPARRASDTRTSPAPKHAEGAERRTPVAASPPVRRLARELGVDLASVEGTGQGGRVTREDVQQAAEAPAEPAGARLAGSGQDQRMPVRGIRRLIAEKMTRSIREIPHVTTFLTVDATRLMAFRDEIASVTNERVSLLTIVVRAFVEVCKEHPKLNSTFDADASEIVLHGRHHVGIATDTDKGLMVPVVRDADSLGIVELSREIARLAEAARSGRASPEDMTGGTVTVTNVGTFGAEFGTPIINHPEAAILALGVIEPRAMVVDDVVEARPAVTLSLAFDHRVLDGAEAGRALKDLGDLLENPFRLGALPR